MRLVLSSILFLLTDNCLFAQNEQTDFEPIVAIIRQFQPAGTVYYGDNADKKIYNKLGVLLNKSFFKSQWDTTNENILKLTAGERKYIQSQLVYSAKLRFPDSLFKDSKRVQKDSLVPFVDGLNRIFLDSISHLPDTIKAIAFRDYRLYRYWSFIFTKPIYIRNRTVTVFYFMYYAMNGGAHGADFYRRKVSKWQRWIMVPGIGGAW